MTNVIQPNDQLFAKSFWSVDSSSQDILMLQNERSTKTLTSLSHFYKEFINLENDYARKFNTLLNKLELPKHENAGTLKTSIDVFQEQCMKISESHCLQASRVNDTLQQPLLELISDRKARQKVLYSKIKQSWNELLELKNKCDLKSDKYEDIWSSMCSLKRTRMTLDNREAEKLEEKLSSMKTKMLIVRQENYELVTKFNQRLDCWLNLWWDTCNELQISEEKKIRFLKANMWEFANILSVFCVEQDQYAENIRTSLQDCSAKKDLDYFVKENSTNNMLFAPLKFIDFAKNETRPYHDQSLRSFNIMEIPSINQKIKEEKEVRQRKRNPPPQSNEQTETAFSYIGKSKETFKELQDQAQKEVSQMKINTPEYNDSKSGSEPSTFKVMSDYSNPTTQTSIYSRSYNDSFEDNVLEYNKNSKENDKRIKSIESIGSRDDDSNYKNSIRNSLVTLKNGDKLRESMSPVKRNSLNKDKHKSLANIMKNAFTEGPTNKHEYKQIIPASFDKKEPNNKFDNIDNVPIEKRINSNSLMLKNPKNVLRASQQTAKLNSHINSTNSLKKSKSQMNLNDRNISLNELPSYSSEGYPVISYAKAHYNYTAAIEEELSFKKKDILLILHKQSDGWWFAENINSGDSGLVPSNYLIEI